MFPLISFMLFPTISSSQSVISGLVTEAQCRAGCLSLWSQPGEERAECWTTCHEPHLCQQEETCGQGCRSACQLLGNRSDRLRGPRHLNTLQFSRIPTIRGCSLSWGPLEVSPNTLQTSVPSTLSAVYLVVGQDRAGQWYELTQTINTSTTLEGTMTAKLARLIVFGLTDSGLQDTVIMDMEGTNCSQMEMLRRSWQKKKTEEKDVGLTPRLVSLGLEEDSSLTEARLVWTGGEGEYLVQWRKLSSSLNIVGNLVTSQTSVEISLESDSLYMVTVREVRGDRVSPDTLISTSVTSPASTAQPADRISTEVIILLVLTLLAVATVMGIILHSRFTENIKVQQQNQFNKQLELGHQICLEDPTSGRSLYRIISQKINQNLSSFRNSKSNLEESKV